MSKIQTIKLVNFKAIDKFEADFNGCTAIITAGNDKGKTSFLKGITDRIRFIRPDMMVKDGEEAGHGEMILDTGEKFIWDFDVNGKDKLVYIDQDAIKQTVTVELGKKFFPPTFDIDKFLQSSPQQQVKQLQLIVGLDFTDVDARYKKAYDNRTARNLEAEKFHVKLSKMLEVPRVAFVDLTDLQAKKEAERLRLNELYKENKAENAKRRQAWETGKKAVDQECAAFNLLQNEKREQFKKATDALAVLKSLGYEGTDAVSFVNDLGTELKADAVASLEYPTEPKYVEEMPDDATLRKIDAEILAASQINVEAQKYQDYIDYKALTDAAKAEADAANDEVRAIEAERRKMIEGVKFPAGIEISPDGITVDGFTLDKNQISTSKLYIAALRIASMCVGEVKSLYFDASYLDNANLASINDWAHEQGFQLLIERPDRDGKDIKYELIE
jgi:hypothetical protein